MATLKLGNNQLIVKYLVNNNGLPYYQRKVPKDLVDRLGKQHIRIKLDDRQGTPARQVLQLAGQHDQLFKALRSNPDLVLSEKKQAAYLLLNNFNLQPGDGNIELTDAELSAGAPDNQPHLNDALDYFIERQRDGKLDEIDSLAYRALKTPLPTLLSELIDVYLKHHPNHKGRDTIFAQKTSRDWNRFITIIGDMPVDRLNRELVRSYISKREEDGVKSGTIQRELNTLRAIITISKREGYFYKDNPFEAIRPNLRNDAKERMPFTFDELALIREKCLDIDDDIRQIVLITMYCGARIGEIVGLRKQDYLMIDKIPCIRITEYGNKTVKTSNSIREIPLLPEANEAVLRAIKASDSDALFPRYNNLKDKPSSNSASTYIAKWLRDITNTDKTSHCFRHTVRDLLRNSDATKDIMDEIHGGAKQNIADTYGQGRTAKKKRDALLKAWKLFFRHIGVDQQNKNQQTEFKKNQINFDF